MHRQSPLAAQMLVRVRPLARKVDRRGVWATYELHDRVLANRRSRGRYASAPPALDELQRGIVAELDTNGFAVVPFAELVADESLATAVAEQGASFIQETERALAGGDGSESLHRRAGKEFVVRAHSFDGARLDPGDAWFRAVVSARLLDLANAYLRMCAKLTYVDLWYTVPQEAGSDRSASQLWHLDFDDKHLLKAFLYLNDVDEESGPFEYVPGSQP